MSRGSARERALGSRFIAIGLCLSLAGVPPLSALAQTTGQSTPPGPADSTRTAAPSGTPTATQAPAPTTPAPAAAPAPQPSEFFHGGVKFLGGPGFPDLKGKETWDNNLTLIADKIVFEFKDNAFPPIEAPLASVTLISYGQASTRHAGRWVAIGVLFAPIALLGVFHKSRKHNILISWTDEKGKERGAFMEVKKEHVRRLLNTLAFRTGKPVFADDQDRKWLMTEGVQAVPEPTVSKETQKK